MRLLIFWRQLATPLTNIGDLYFPSFGWTSIEREGERETQREIGDSNLATGVN